MKSEDEIFKKIFKSMDVEIIPPKESMGKIFEALNYKPNQANYRTSLCYTCFFERLVKLSIPLSILLTVFMQVEAH